MIGTHSHSPRFWAFEPKPELLGFTQETQRRLDVYVRSQQLATGVPAALPGERLSSMLDMMGISRRVPFVASKSMTMPFSSTSSLRIQAFGGRTSDATLVFAILRVLTPKFSAV